MNDHDLASNVFSRRQLLKGMGIGIVGLGLAACAPSAGPDAASGGEGGGAAEATEVIWHCRTGNNEIYYSAEAEKYHEAQDAVRVVIEATPNSDYQSKLATLVAGGELGDSYWGNVFGQLYPFASAGVALDVRPIVDEADWWSDDDYFQVGIDQISVDGMLIGLPLGGHPGWTSLYTNITEWEKAGVPLPEWEWTYTDPWLDIVKELSLDEDGDGEVDRFGYSFDYSAQNTYNFIRSFGGDWVDPETRTESLVDSEETTAAMAFMRSLVEDHKVSPMPEQIAGGNNESFINQQTVSWSHGIWFYGTGIETIGDAFEWRGFPVPAGPDGTRGSFIGCDTFCVNSQGKEIDATMEWGKWLMGNDARLASVKGGGSAPFLKESWEDPFLAEDDTFQAMLQWLEVAKPWTVPANARALEFRNTFNQSITSVLDPNSDFQTEVNNLHLAIQGVLDKPPV